MKPPALTTGTPLDNAARRLLGAKAVRERAQQMLTLATSGSLDHFAVDTARLEATCDYVVRVVRSNYPNLAVPHHSRWRHFELGEFDRWGKLAATRQWPDRLQLARAAIDLAFVSILLDAEPGTKWAYAEAETGETLGRTEGVAVATLTMFGRGVFSADPFDPLRADARALGGLTQEELADGFQISTYNPLAGSEARLGTIHALGQALQRRADVFTAPDGIRPGGLMDYFIARADRGRISAPFILDTLLDMLGSVFPGRFMLGNTPLGDVWPHRKLYTGDATDGLVPMHRVAQWLAYSLIEPLIWGGLQITDVDGLTGLADYRSGGLLIDMGVLKLKSANAALEIYPVDHELVIEWRALTIALLDKVADGMRRRLSRTKETFPLACVMEGGTWSAGRRIARERRSDASMPIKLDNAGTTF